MWIGYLFTDIEGSTAHWERSPERMQAAIARHDVLVETLIARHGGIVQSRAGDGVFAVFLNGSALCCAGDLQQTLQAEDWSLVDSLWVRIGVHASFNDRAAQSAVPATVIDQVAVNRAARIMACGWGGQTVVSHEAVQAFGAPPDSELDDLGICRLRGIDEPLRLYGLTHADLKRSEFPPLHSLSARSQNIPAQRTPLFGRERELQDITALLGKGQAVTIVGPGGNGKTRLAAEIALKASGERPVYFVLLAGVGSAAELVSQIASTLRFPFHRNAPRENQLVAYLRDRTALLVLDNADAASADSKILERIVASCPGVSVLATSRGGLGFAGEALYPLHGLELPRRSGADITASPAFQFFAYEARAVRASFELDEDAFSALAEICALLSGSPLALRLAAHWSRLLSLEDILARLRVGLDFLDVSDLDRTDGKRTLRGVFEGSWSLLPPDLQAALARLSVIAGDFDVEAAKAVAQIDAAVLGALEQLGLVTQSGRWRFQMHAIIREYAREKLSDISSEPTSTLNRHADYYLGMVRSGIGRSAVADQGRVLDQLQSHTINVRTAWMHTLARGSREQITSIIEPLFYFLTMRSLFHEASQLFGVEAPDDEVLLYSRSLVVNCLVHQGEFEKAAALGAEVLAARPANPLIEAHAVQALGNLAHMRGDVAMALERYDVALGIRMRANDHMGSVYSIVSLAALHLQRAELAEARQRIREAFRLCRRTGNTTMMMSVTMFAGDIAMQESRLLDARKNYSESLRLEEMIHNPQYRTGALLRLGIADSRLGDTDAAADHFQEALELASDIGDRRLKTSALLELGANLRVGKDMQEALRLLSDAVRLAVSVGSDPLIVRGLLEIGWVQTHLGNLSYARKVARTLAVFELGSHSSDYELLREELGKDDVLPLEYSDRGSAIDEILEDAEIGVLSL